MEEKKKKAPLRAARILHAARIGARTGFLEDYGILDDRTLDKFRAAAADGDENR